MFKKIGPGVLIAAAFIGPGTITACTIAGVNFNYALLWALAFSVFATIVLQEMASRLGLVSKKGLTEVLKEQLHHKTLRFFVLSVVLAAILVGNAAYEGGNIGGATLGLQAIVSTSWESLYPLIIGMAVFVLLWYGNYKLLQKVFLGLICLMSLSFMITALVTKPDIAVLLRGLLVPSFPENSLLNVIALVGTTVVPYNLFLHASLVNERWKSTEDLKTAKWDTILAIGLGGLVSMAIIVAASAIPSQSVAGVMDLISGLEPLYGKWAKYFMGVGLLAAGVTSSITAPLAGAYVARNCFGWPSTLKDWRFRAVWIGILAAGVLSLSFNVKPIEIIKFAQIANGILLPVIAVILLWAVNRVKVMGNYRNSKWQNVLGCLIVGFTFFLGVKSILKVLAW
ncbi:Mn2+/Fe2+ transporter, NRAMP family protein [Croceitalea dokdonensis DOKDO 023]|uniref:Mn2+/Fe2+ transporter, NRAMP family protein n=1 Tax=Croceitalea dokdonensis DOKDO 023 TaxID=1300341 RepID=A0A0P7AIZ8_9FLAO|nr:Nramp family divalent metal transporter [Croceitalea dokdonensis]KPM33577.1 Mn2+/Fe2+ transporter, NRAMP family protein [Croceitalea dokdonensis DOKDO 023]